MSTTVTQNVYNDDGAKTGTIEVRPGARGEQLYVYASLDGKLRGETDSFNTALDRLDGFRWEVAS